MTNEIDMEIEIQVLNEALREAEELTDGLNAELEIYRRKVNLLESLLDRNGISYRAEYILLDA